MTEPLSSAEIKLLRLAEILGVNTGHGWKKRLAKRLNVKQATLQGWCTRDSLPKSAAYAAEKAGVRPDRWMAGPLEYTTAPEHLDQPNGGRGDITAPDAGSYGAPDLSGHRITQTYQPDEQWYIDAVREILRSGEHGTIIALQSNITQFREQVRDKAFIKTIQAQNQELNRRVAELERSAQSTKKADQARGPSDGGPGEDDGVRSLRIDTKKDIQGAGNE